MRLLPILALLGCPQDPGFLKPDPEDTAEDDTAEDTDDTEPIDTEDTDGDLDDDGFTPEEGDCDDDDVRIAPGREEDDGDDIDNDCDGLIDEEWSGFTYAWITDAGDAWLQQIDKLGELGDETTVTGCYPLTLDRWGDGYSTTDGGSVYQLAADGTCTELAAIESDYGVWSVATAADGSAAYATIVNALYTVAADGTSTAVGEWTETNDEGTETFYITSIAVDPTSGEVGLFEYTGGFGIYTEAGGVEQLKIGNIAEQSLTILAGGVRPGDGWYAIAQDASTSEYLFLRWDGDALDWVESDRWTSDWTPAGLTMEGDYQDFYYTANGAWTPAVFRIVEGGNYVANLYVAEATEYQFFYGIVADYTHD